MRSVSLVTVALLTVIANSAAHAGGCAAEISAYRRAHGLSAVRADTALDRIAGQQAAAMARAGTVSHDVNGNFFVRIAPVHRRLAAENVAAGFLSCEETIRQWDTSSGQPRQSLDAGRAACRRRVGCKAVIALSASGPW